jgi:hypothetical protein
MRFVIALLLSLLLLSGALTQSQIQTEKGKKTLEIVDRVRQLDLLNHILPVLITKEQLKKLLPVIEKSRQNVRKAQDKEYDTIRTVETELNKAYNDALDKGAVPTREFLTKLMKMGQALSLHRALIADENTDELIKAMRETLNAGQTKAAANALNPALFEPGLKVDQMTEDQKLRFYVKEIMLDPLTYPVLLELYKRMKS